MKNQPAASEFSPVEVTTRPDTPETRAEDRQADRELAEELAQPSCNRCGDVYELRPGCEPTPECDSCAHIALAELRGVSPRANELLKSANKWLRRLDERRDELPKSFFRGCDPRPLRKAITKFLR